MIRGLGLGTDARALHEFAERHRRDHGPVVIKIARQETIDDKAPVEGQPAARRPHQLEDDGRAVGGDRIVPFRLCSQLRRLDDIFPEQRPSLDRKSVV